MIDDDGQNISIDPEDGHEERALSDVLPSRIGPSVTHRVTFLRRLSRGDGASVIALVIALSLHASVIAAGIYYYRAFVLEQPPQVLIPKGTATEATAGTAEDGARLAAALMMPFNMSPPGAADPATTPPDLSNPPREFQPPDVTPPPLAIDANNGTADYGPLPTFAADRSPPVVGARFPPGMQSPSDKSDNTRTSEPQSSASQSSGNPASEAGQDSSGAPQGIADGMPVASSHNRQPLYPQIALRNGWEGVTLLKLDLDETGRVCAVRLLRSSGHELLDQKAIEAAKAWSYTPAMINGHPLAATVKVPIVFSRK